MDILQFVNSSELVNVKKNSFATACFILSACTPKLIFRPEYSLYHFLQEKFIMYKPL